MTTTTTTTNGNVTNAQRAAWAADAVATYATRSGGTTDDAMTQLTAHLASLWHHAAAAGIEWKQALERSRDRSIVDNALELALAEAGLLVISDNALPASGIEPGAIASDALVAIAAVRPPTEEEASELRRHLVDEEGRRGYVAVTPTQVEQLKTLGIIAYCNSCTGFTITACSDDDDGGYTAAEYHILDDTYEEDMTKHTWACVAAAMPDIPGIAAMVDADEKPCTICTERSAMPGDAAGTTNERSAVLSRTAPV